MITRTRPFATPVALALFIAAGIAGVAKAQDQTVPAQPDQDFRGIGAVLDNPVGNYLSEGLKRGDSLADDPRYPAFTVRTDPSTGNAFFSKFGGDTHRNRAAGKGAGIFNIFK